MQDLARTLKKQTWHIEAGIDRPGAVPDAQSTVSDHWRELEALTSTSENHSQLGPAWYSLKHKVLRCSGPAGWGGFSVHAVTVLWRWRTSANVVEDCSRWPELQYWNFICWVPLLFLAQPDLHIPQNRDQLGRRDSPSVSRRAGIMQNGDALRFTLAVRHR